MFPTVWKLYMAGFIIHLKQMNSTILTKHYFMHFWHLLRLLRRLDLFSLKNWHMFCFPGLWLNHAAWQLSLYSFQPRAFQKPQHQQQQHTALLSILSYLSPRPPNIPKHIARLMAQVRGAENYLSFLSFSFFLLPQITPSLSEWVLSLNCFFCFPLALPPSRTHMHTHSRARPRSSVATKRKPLSASLSKALWSNYWL